MERFKNKCVKEEIYGNYKENNKNNKSLDVATQKNSFEKVDKLNYLRMKVTGYGEEKKYRKIIKGKTCTSDNSQKTYQEKLKKLYAAIIWSSVRYE